MLRICADVDGHNARTLLIRGVENVDRQTLFDNEVHPKLAVFTVNNGQSLDINGTATDNIPIGIYLEKKVR